MPAVPAIAMVATVASVGLQGAGMIQGRSAAKQQAATAKAVAEYNSRVELANAKQVELDMDANTRTARRDAQVFTSRQRAAYAAAGVLDSGSALAVEAETVGRIEQNILQGRTNAQRESRQREAAARMGVLYGNAQASGIMMQSTADMLRGGAQMLSTIGNAASAGVFGGPKPGGG